MPKYIITKDKIYNVFDLHESKELNGNVLVDKNGWCIYPEDITKQADTIEDLIDIFADTSALNDIHNGAFYYGYKKKALIYFNESEDTRYIPISEWDDKSVIKGAIWTDKGLIYVAKMNKKGELELL